MPRTRPSPRRRRCASGRATARSTASCAAPARRHRRARSGAPSCLPASGLPAPPAARASCTTPSFLRRLLACLMGVRFADELLESLLLIGGEQLPDVRPCLLTYRVHPRADRCLDGREIVVAPVENAVDRNPLRRREPQIRGESIAPAPNRGIIGRRAPGVVNEHPTRAEAERAPDHERAQQEHHRETLGALHRSSRYGAMTKCSVISRADAPSDTVANCCGKERGVSMTIS